MPFFRDRSQADVEKDIRKAEFCWKGCFFPNIHKLFTPNT